MSGSQEHAKHGNDSPLDTRPLWRRVNPTLVALVVAIGAVAAIALSSSEAPRKSAPASSEQAATAPRHKLEPRALVGALLKRPHRRHRAHTKKKASLPAAPFQKRSESK